VILAESIQDNAENFTRFVLLIPVVARLRRISDSAIALPRVADLMIELKVRRMEQFTSGTFLKMSIALRLAHKPARSLRARAVCPSRHQSDEKSKAARFMHALDLSVLP